jgi:hypothetical protein
MSIKCIIFMIVFFTLITFSAAQAQQAASSTGAGNNEIIDLAAEVYKIPVEAPQVKLLTDRIKPEFDSVHLDKSFRKEITGGGERFILEPMEKDAEIEKADVSKLLNRKR